MTRETTIEAATVEEALAAGLEELGITKETAGYEVLAEPGKGFLGMTAKRVARVRVWDRTSGADPVDDGAAENADVEALGEELEDVAELPAELKVAPAAAPSPDEAPLTDDELDAIADAAVETIKNVLRGFDIEATIDEYEGDDGEIILDVVGGDLAIMIGRHGRTLEAFQTLVSAITNRKIGRRYPVLVDVEGYRSRRKSKLEEMAANAADRARRTGREVRLRPMSSYERRVIHVALREDRRVETASEGEDPFRRVVVSPK
jgi:spoIIIJ-associated protein